MDRAIRDSKKSAPRAVEDCFPLFERMSGTGILNGFDFNSIENHGHIMSLILSKDLILQEQGFSTKPFEL